LRFMAGLSREARGFTAVGIDSQPHGSGRISERR
jgi:hypothetical protein